MSGAEFVIPAAALAAVLAAANPDGAALTRLGLAGDWAVDCQKPLGSDNPGVAFEVSGAAPGDRPPRYIEKGAQGAVGEADIGDVRALADGRIALSLTIAENSGGQDVKIVLNNVLIKDGNRFRFLEVKTGGGQVSVSGGIKKANGEATTWLQKCGG